MPVNRTRAFSLTELLVVLTIISVLAALSTPAIHALNGAGTVNKAAADLSRTLELARTYALANNTYVRVLMSQRADSEAPASDIVVLTVYSIDGTTHGDMNSASDWPLLNRPLILENLAVDDSLESRSPDTHGDDLPAGTTITMQRTLPGATAPLSFEACVEFSPSGSAGVLPQTVSRYIKIACDRPKAGGQPSTNPFIVRLSGVNGSIQVLRKEDLL